MEVGAYLFRRVVMELKTFDYELTVCKVENPGMSETIQLEKGKWYIVQAAGDITIQMVNVREP